MQANISTTFMCSIRNCNTIFKNLIASKTTNTQCNFSKGWQVTSLNQVTRMCFHCHFESHKSTICQNHKFTPPAHLINFLTVHMSSLPWLAILQPNAQLQHLHQHRSNYAAPLRQLHCYHGVQLFCRSTYLHGYCKVTVDLLQRSKMQLLLCRYQCSKCAIGRSNIVIVNLL